MLSTVGKRVCSCISMSLTKIKSSGLKCTRRFGPAILEFLLLPHTPTTSYPPLHVWTPQQLHLCVMESCSCTRIYLLKPDTSGKTPDKRGAGAPVACLRVLCVYSTFQRRFCSCCHSRLLTDGFALFMATRFSKKPKLCLPFPCPFPTGT